jgi:hypothetical protein
LARQGCLLGLSGYNQSLVSLFWDSPPLQDGRQIELMIHLHRFERTAVVFLALSLAVALQAQTTKVTVNAVFPPVSYLPFPGPHYANDFLKYVATSPFVDGVSAPLLWSMVDNGPEVAGGQYDWTKFDAVIQPYLALGKTVNLIVWPISETGPNSLNESNHATPAYVMNQVDSVTCPGFPGDGTRTGAYPVVWETNFKKYYKQFIQEVVKHYLENPNIGYVRFGLLGGGTAYPNCETQLTPYLPAGTAFRAEVFSFYREMLSYIESQGAPFSVIAPFTAFNNDTVYAKVETSTAIADGFGLGFQGLRASDLLPGQQCSSDWCNLFAQYASVKPSPLLELQPVGQSDPSATCTPSCWDGVQQQTGSLPPLLSFGVGHDANLFEIYANDLLLALDPFYPGYSEYHEEYQKALSAVHSGKPTSVTTSVASLNFGGLAMGSSSAPQLIIVTNIGSSVLKIHGITVVGSFSETDDCALQSLSPGQQCSISVVFKPTALGKLGGIVKIEDSDPWSPHVVGLVGTGQK